MPKLINLEDILKFHVPGGRVLHSATHEEIMGGATTDIYFIRTRELLHHAGRKDISAVAEIFCSKEGVFAGIEEAAGLLRGIKGVSVWALKEGEQMARREVVMRISGPYSEYGAFETVILGMLASASGWATAARACVEAAGGKPLLCFGARHVHPAVAPVMERAALIGGATSCSCILGAKLLGKEPVGTVPHAAILMIGDTLEAAVLYDRVMPVDSPRVILVDTFKDEAEETLRVAGALKERLDGVRLDTSAERGGVTPGLVKEVRARLDLAGYPHVRIFVSGGIIPERMPALIEAGADAFGVGSFISGAGAIDMTMDIKVIDGNPVAKRGRIPGLTASPRLVQYF